MCVQADTLSAVSAFNSTNSLAANYSYSNRVIWGGDGFQALASSASPIPKLCLPNVIQLTGPPALPATDPEAQLTLKQTLQLLPALGKAAATFAASNPFLLNGTTLQTLNQTKPPASAATQAAMQQVMNSTVQKMISYLNSSTASHNTSNATVSISSSYPVETFFGALRSFPSLFSQFGGMYDWALVPNITAAPFQDNSQYIAFMVQSRDKWPYQLDQLESLFWVLISHASGQISDLCPTGNSSSVATGGRRLQSDALTLSMHPETLQNPELGRQDGRQLLASSCLSQAQSDANAASSLVCKSAVVGAGNSSLYAGVQIASSLLDIYGSTIGLSEQTAFVSAQGKKGLVEFFSTSLNSGAARWVNAACRIVSSAANAYVLASKVCTNDCTSSSFCRLHSAGCVTDWQVS